MVKIYKYYATWCGPCEKYGPIFEQATKDKGYEIHNVDVDQNLSLAAANRINQLPTTVIEGPRGSKRRTGILTPEKIEELVQSVI